MSDTDKYIKTSRKNFEDSFKTLNKNLDMYGMYTPWLLFKIRNQYDTGLVRDSLIIDTYNSQATVTLPTGESQKISHVMLTNFEYNKSGAGTANTFSISFAFNPAEKQDNGKELINPQIIDMALMTSSILEIDKSSKNEKRNAINAIAKHQVYMRYGYVTSGFNQNSDDASTLLSPEYFGQALEASSELRDGLIYYTITGYSNITYLNNLEVAIPERGTQDESGEYSGCWKVTDAMWEAIAMYFGDKTTGRQPTIENFDKLFKGKEAIIINSKPDYLVEKEVHIEQSGEHETLWEYLDRVKKLVNFEVNDTLAEDSRLTVEWRIEEYDNIMYFYIYVVDPRIPGKDNNQVMSNNDERFVNVVYEYPTKSNNIVKSFTPDFKFETVWGSDIIVENSPTSYYVDEKGNVYSYEDISSYNDSLSGNGKFSSLATYASAIQYNYEANLVTLGIPADIPISTVIRIRPIINGIEYHYGGYYMITKTTDRIDTNGYTTEYNLIKLITERQASHNGVSTVLSNTSNQIWRLVDSNGNIMLYDNEKDYQNALAKQQLTSKIETSIGRKMTYNEEIAAGLKQGPYAPGTEEAAKKTVSDALGIKQTSSTNTKLTTSSGSYNRTIEKTNFANLDVKLANNVQNNKKSIYNVDGNGGFR